MEYKDYYKTLGLKRDAPQDEVKKAYRRLARKFHPDICKEADAEQKFKEIGEAYEVLKDPEKRAAYDRFGSNWQHGQEFKPPPNWDEGSSFSQESFTEGDPFGYSDFFTNLFGGGRFQSGHTTFRASGQDEHAKIVISIEEACRGTSSMFTLTRPEVGGSGQLVNRQQTINVTIPKGVIEGQRIRLKGQGQPGLGGGESGDLYLEIAFAEHDRFHTENRDLHLTLPVTPWEAALGGIIDVDTLEGKVKLKVPAGSQSGSKLRLKGKGICSKLKSGDLYVTLKIVTPKAETDEQKKLYEKMARIMPMDPRVR